VAYTWTIRASGFPSGCIECGRTVHQEEPIAWHRLIGGTRCLPCAKTLWTTESGIDWPRIERAWIAKHPTYEVEPPRVVAGACPRCGALVGDDLHTFLRRHRCGDEPPVCGVCGYPVGRCAGCGEAIALGAEWEPRAEREGKFAFALTRCRHYHPGHQLLADERLTAEREASRALRGRDTAARPQAATRPHVSARAAPRWSRSLPQPLERRSVRLPGRLSWAGCHPRWDCRSP
jgi:hypothetical protein